MTESRDNTQDPKKSIDLSRRSFLKGAGVTSIGVAVTGGTSYVQRVAADSSKNLVGPSGVSVSLNVNGKNLKAKVEPRMTLAEVLREQFNLTGTKIGCERGACGACTVIVGKKTVPACMTLALDAVDQPIQTIEGLENNGDLHPIQEAFIQQDALQCGFCTPGMIMSCKHLLDHKTNPSLSDVQEAVSGNTCRCGSYPNVFDAVLKVSGKKGE